MGIFRGATKTEMLVADIKRRWPRFFVEADEEIWKQWHELTKRDSISYFVDILKGDYNDRFKARAILALLAPTPKNAPKNWNLVTPFSSIYGFELDLVANCEKFIEYIVDLVVSFFRLTLEGKDEFTDHLSLANRYNSWMIALLGYLPEGPDADNLFNRISLNDLVCFNNMDDCSGYNPFSHLMWNPKVNERYKRLADLKMRVTVRAELQGEAKPRAEHESAFAHYADRVTSFVGLKKNPYSIALFADQIGFLLALNLKGCRLFPTYNERLLLALIGTLTEDDVYALEIMRRYVRYMVFENVGFSDEKGFLIYDQEDLDLATRWHAEYGKDDPELALVLLRKIAEGRERVETRLRKEREVQEHQNAVLSRMK